MYLRVGITGHRLNKLESGARERVAASLARVFRLLDEAARAVAGEGCPDPRIALLSGLAEGADRIAVRSAPPSWSLTAVLPMPREDYVRDFLPPDEVASDSLAEFDALLGEASRVVEIPSLAGGHVPEGAGRERQYAALGRHLVDHADILVAVWDGHPAEGPGGTADVVTEAVARGRPTLWIDPHRPDGAMMITRFVLGEPARPEPLPFDAFAAEAIMRGLRAGMSPIPA